MQSTELTSIQFVNSKVSKEIRGHIDEKSHQEQQVVLHPIYYRDICVCNGHLNKKYRF